MIPLKTNEELIKEQEPEEVTHEKGHKLHEVEHDKFMNLLKNTSMKHAMLKTQPSKKPS
jgi:hypothetical protein